MSKSVRKRFAVSGSSIDLYLLLGLPRDAIDDEIETAFRARARDFHPDRTPGPEALEVFKTLSHGIEILRDPIKRARYDQGEIDAFGRETGPGRDRIQRIALARMAGYYFALPFAAVLALAAAVAWTQGPPSDPKFGPARQDVLPIVKDKAGKPTKTKAGSSEGIPKGKTGDGTALPMSWQVVSRDAAATLNDKGDTR